MTKIASRGGGPALTPGHTLLFYRCRWTALLRMVDFASSFLEGTALLWFLSCLESRRTFANLAELKESLSETFGLLHEEDDRLNLFALTQTGPLHDYVQDFSRLSLNATALDEHFRDLLFVRGLIDGLRADAMREHLRTLLEAIRAGRTARRNAVLTRPRGKVGSSRNRRALDTADIVASTEQPVSSQQFKRQKLTDEERAKSMRESRCFRCRRGRKPLKGPPTKQLRIPKRRSPMISRVQSLARHHAPELRLQYRFDGLEDELIEMTCTDPSPENSQPAPSQTRTINEDSPMTFDQTISDESLEASPSTAHVPGKDIHATLGKKRIRTAEPEISIPDVSEDTEHSLLCFSGKLAGKDAVLLVESGSTHDFVSQNLLKNTTLKLSVRARNFRSPLSTAVRFQRSSQ